MTYLIAKFAIIFLLAGLLGFLLGRWTVRRSFVDVTESYESLRESQERDQWQTLWTRLDATDNNIQAVVAAEVEKVPQPEFPAIPEYPSLDGIHQRLETLELAIKNLPEPEKPQPVTFDPVNQRIDRVESALRSIDIPKAPELSPVNDRLKIIEMRLTQLTDKPQTTPPVVITNTDGPRLLKTASYGEKDDLKRISGVGPKLERLLNRHGVFYFWQVAEWSQDDVQTMDDRLEVFKGRIERDDWVVQAGDLKQHSSSVPPGD